MKKILITFLGLFIGINTFSQSISCSELYNMIVNNYDHKESTMCFNSSVLVRAEYYQLDNMGFVIAYIKANEYDLQGTPYIFCGISSYTWTSFTSDGMFGSWGKAFHEYIRNNLCDCY